MTDLLLPTDSLDAQRAERRAMIVADDAHVTYRVYASGKRFSARDNLLSLKTFRGGRDLQEVPALRGVSFTAGEGETIGVVGHNGSGKSTLFRAMTGLIPTSGGTIWARDRPVLLGVNAALVPELSGENNIKLGLLAMGYTPEEAAAQVDEIADFAELNEFIHHPMRTYSSGMAARLRFAIASAKAHSILLIDEALAVGDRRFKAKSEKRIRELQEQAGLVMIVSHSAGSLRDTCERVLWIHKGELVADGPSGDVIADYVKWTKQPGSTAVGAAAATKTKAAPKPPTFPPAKPAAQTSAVPVAAPRAAAAPQEPSLFDELLAVASAGAGERENPRTAARRDRFRRTARERRRRRLIALMITLGVLLLAVAAGAAIGILTRVPDPAPAPAGAPITAGPPVITTFTSSTESVVCASEDEEATARFTWRVDNARVVAVATGAVEIDAVAAPLRNDLPAVAVEQELPFACAEETQVYTLTAEGRDGERVSHAITVTRVLVPVAEELPVPQQTQQPVPDRQPQAPQQPAPAPAPEPSTEPEPTDPAPEPTEPAPEPTEPAPEPTEPAPEPTEPAPEPTQPPETEPGPAPVIPVDPTSALDI
ncbi:ABC transporter ATP-binding protein [Microbacterium sp. MC2]